MIRTLMANSFPEWLRQTLANTPDELTGLPMKASRLAELIGVSEEKVSSWSTGRRKPLNPEDVHALAQALNHPEWEILQALGYRVMPGLTDEERELLAAYQRLSPGLREAARRVVRALPEPQEYRPRRQQQRVADSRSQYEP